MARLLAGQRKSYWEVHPDRDLWHLAHRILSEKRGYNITVQWTKAHRQLHQALNFDDMWQVWHNSKADYEAGQTLQRDLTGELQEKRSVLLTTFREINMVRSKALNFIRDVLDRFDGQ